MQGISAASALGSVLRRLKCYYGSPWNGHTFWQWEEIQEASLPDQTEKSTGQTALACVTVQRSGKQALPIHCGKISNFDVILHF